METKISEMRAQISSLQQQLDALVEQRDLTRRLLHLGESEPQLGPSVSNPVYEGRNNVSDAARNFREQKENDIEDHLEELLTVAGKPVHIREIREGLIQKGVPLPGRGDEANIILRLRRSTDRFVRTGRGMYALASWGLPEVKPTRKKIIKRRGRQ